MKPEGTIKGYHELPPGLLPKYVKNPLAPKVHANGRGAAEYESETWTRRKAYHYVCSANELCSEDLLVYGVNSNETDVVARQRGWSVLTGLGWTCKECSRLYHRGPIGRRAGKIKPITVLDRLLAEEPRGNDQAEIREPS